MVICLADLIQRRLFSDMAGMLSEHDLNIIASEMALLLKWSPVDLAQEIEEVKQVTG